jgi:hypothetical protein
MIDLPEDYPFEDEDLIEVKGYVSLNIFHKRHGMKTFHFYDLCRFNQDVKDELRQQNYFFDCNVVILDRVNRTNIMNFLSSYEGWEIFEEEP